MNFITVNGRILPSSKVVCVGRNYVEHIKELNNEIPTQMVIFLKPNSAICSQIHLTEETLHYEAELSFVITAGKISAVGLGLDLTNRTLQKELKEKGLPWERAKAFDNSAVFSEFVDFNGDIKQLSFSLSINNKQVQQGDVSLMIHSPLKIIEEINRIITLQDGDIVMTGTPKGVGEIKTNDLFSAQLFYRNELLIEQQWKVK